VPKTAYHDTRVVAVSGGIGSGKTTVCGIMADLGATLFNADSVAKYLMEHDDALRTAITAAFGDEAYQPDGSLDRAFLAGRVFSSETNRQKINAIVHPHVAAAFRDAVRRARDAGTPLLVHESALITEVNHRDDFDAIIIVESPEEVRLHRVSARDNTPPDKIAARAALQPTAAAYRAVADYIIVNDGSLDDLTQRVTEVVQAVLAPRNNNAAATNAGRAGATDGGV
jgi:dephospho-CoA kinase